MGDGPLGALAGAMCEWLKDGTGVGEVGTSVDEQGCYFSAQQDV